jgi:hypothetical protein
MSGEPLSRPTLAECLQCWPPRASSNELLPSVLLSLTGRRRDSTDLLAIRRQIAPRDSATARQRSIVEPRCGRRHILVGVKSLFLKHRTDNTMAFIVGSDGMAVSALIPAASKVLDQNSVDAVGDNVLPSYTLRNGVPNPCPGLRTSGPGVGSNDLLPPALTRSRLPLRRSRAAQVR